MSSAVPASLGYHSFTKLLHWSMFVLFTIMFVLGFGLMGGDESSTAFGAEWDTVFDWHATLGLSVLVMAVVRLGWRGRTALPPWALGLSTGEQQLAHRTEQVMYAVMFVKPVSGYVLAGAAGHKIDLFGVVGIGNPFGANEALNDIALAFHILSGVAFLIAWVIHVGQALRHQFVKRDGLLERMLPGTPRPRPGT